MKIIVLIKQVPDTETKIKIHPQHANQLDMTGVKWIINPYDEFAIEEALKIKEKLSGGASVVALTLGPQSAEEALRTALAMGVDDALFIESKEAVLDGYGVAKALSVAIQKEGSFDLILCGKQSVDSDGSMVYGFLSSFLNLPEASVVVKTDLSQDNKSMKVEREMEGGMKQIIELALPALVAVNKGINTPRYASLPGIMKAKKKQIKKYTLSDLGLESEKPQTIDGDYKLPPERKAGKILSGDIPSQVQELVRLLHEEAKVI